MQAVLGIFQKLVYKEIWCTQKLQKGGFSLNAFS